MQKPGQWKDSLDTKRSLWIWGTEHSVRCRPRLNLQEGLNTGISSGQCSPTAMSLSHDIFFNCSCILTPFTQDSFSRQCFPLRMVGRGWGLCCEQLGHGSNCLDRPRTSREHEALALHSMVFLVSLQCQRELFSDVYLWLPRPLVFEWSLLFLGLGHFLLLSCWIDFSVPKVFISAFFLPCGSLGVSFGNIYFDSISSVSGHCG